jgi:predicted secreted acid phosphatase
MTSDLLADWRAERPKPRAVICDIDDTLCTQFDCPIETACALLRRLDRAFAGHYVTARPEASRAGTEKFLLDHRLPGWRNLHFCPSYLSSRRHKAQVMTRLAQDYHVVVSIGDHQEDEDASHEAGIVFVRVGDDNLESAWQQVAVLVGIPGTDSP